MSRWYAFVLVLTITWALTIVWVLNVPPFDDAVRALGVSFAIEALLVLASLAYIWAVRRQTGEPASWLLWLFAFGAAVMLFGLIPGLVSLTSRALFGFSYTDTPGLFLASSLLFIGVVPIVTAFVIWRHRRRL